MIALFLIFFKSFWTGQGNAKFWEIWISLSNIWAWAEKSIAYKTSV